MRAAISNSGQMEFSSLNPAETSSGDALPSFPVIQISEYTTPAAIVAWWDQLVDIFTGVAVDAEQRAQPIRSELAALKGSRTPEAKRRIRRLRTEGENLMARAEAAEAAAYALFEGTLSEFSPRLIQLLQAEGLDIPDDDEIAIAHFWDCLQRPTIEWCASMPLAEIARHFCAGMRAEPTG